MILVFVILKRKITMKIICKSNFDHESVPDKLVAENVNSYYGNYIVAFLNNKFSGNDSPYYFMIVKDDYILYKFEP